MLSSAALWSPGRRARPDGTTFWLWPLRSAPHGGYPRANTWSRLTSHAGWARRIR